VPVPHHHHGFFISLTQVKVLPPAAAVLRTAQNKIGKIMTQRVLVLTTAAALMLGAAVPALAQSQGDMTVGLGLHWIEPTNDDSNTAAGPITVDGNLRPTVTFEYFIADNIGVELLASFPFKHDINLGGAGEVGDTKHLPPTLSLQYHFANGSQFTPFVGAGINYTYFFDENGKGALAGSRISLDDSWGVAFHAGIDMAFGDNGALRADVRYIDIDTDAKVDGTNIGSVKIDPWVFGAAYVYKF
jgi:outer membrane protein